MSCRVSFTPYSSGYSWLLISTQGAATYAIRARVNLHRRVGGKTFALRLFGSVLLRIRADIAAVWPLFCN